MAFVEASRKRTTSDSAALTDLSLHLQKPLSEDLRSLLPLGIAESTFQFMRVIEPLIQDSGIPTNQDGEAVIAMDMYTALRQLILDGVSLNRIDVGTKKWDGKKRRVKDALRDLAQSYELPEEVIPFITEFFTPEARMRRVRDKLGEQTILSAVKLEEERVVVNQLTAERRNAAKRLKRQVDKQEKDTISDQMGAILTPETLTQYMQWVREIPPVDNDEELVLLKAAQQGNKNARETLILAYLRQVVDIAHHYTGKGVSLVDLVGEGNVALVQAIDTLVVTGGESVAHTVQTLVANQLKKICSPREFHRSITEPIIPGESLTIESTLADTPALEPENVFLHEEFWEEARGILTPKEMDIVGLRYGVEGFVVDREEIARRYRISVEEMQQIENQALNKLRFRILLAS